MNLNETVKNTFCTFNRQQSLKVKNSAFHDPLYFLECSICRTYNNQCHVGHISADVISLHF